MESAIAMATLPRSSLSLPGAFAARALLLGERLDMRGLEHPEALARAPLVLRIGSQGLAVLFRYGVIVLFNVGQNEESAFVAQLLPRVTDPYDARESEELRILLRAEADEQLDQDSTLTLKEATVERMQLIADCLAKSLMLAHYETRIAAIFDRIEPLAAALRERGRAGKEGRLLLSQIGRVLLVQHKMVGRVETGEKPELLWDHPALERLYVRLSDEFELRDRDRAMDRKLDLISRTVETLLGLVQQSRNLRLEWYVVLLIVVEVVLTVYPLVIK
jgi:required for meiotic nuclear division protein 1